MKGYNIKVRLKNFKPITWRDLIIPSNITFKGLHEIIQIIMGFDNSHLYDFSFKDSRYNIIDFETNEDQFLAFDSDSVCINKFFDNYKIPMTTKSPRNQLFLYQVMPHKHYIATLT